MKRRQTMKQEITLTDQELQAIIAEHFSRQVSGGSGLGTSTSRYVITGMDSQPLPQLPRCELVSATFILEWDNPTTEAQAKRLAELMERVAIHGRVFAEGSEALDAAKRADG